MLRYIVRRTVSAVVVVLGVVALTFLIARVVPGNPAASWIGPRATPAEIAVVSRQLGLNRPVPVQIWNYFRGIAGGNWGISIHTHRSVLSDIVSRLPASLELVISALIIAVVVGVALGLIAARWQGKTADHVIKALTVIAASMPVFWLALLMQWIFFQKLHWLPVAGEYSLSLTYTHPLHSITGIPVIDALLTGNWPVFGSAITHLILPAFVVSTYAMGVIARMVRASVLDVTSETHAQMLRTLGFSERSIINRFALRLAWSPVAQVVALVFAYSLVNTFLVEAVYNWPGLGSYATDSISSLDTPAIVGLTLFIAVLYVLLNLAVDIFQAVLDPRIRLT